MSNNLTRRFQPLVALLTLFVFVGNSIAVDAGLKIEAILVWGTNDSNPTDSKLKAVSPELAKKLKKSPFKWNNYFEVKSQILIIPQGAKKKVEMSPKCEIQIENLGKSMVAVELFGQKKSTGGAKHP